MNIAERNQGDRIAQKGAKAQMDIINANIDKLKLNDRGGKMENAVKEFTAMAKNGSKFSPKQMSFIDVIYERTMGNAGFGEAKTTSKKKHKAGLRYG